MVPLMRDILGFDENLSYQEGTGLTEIVRDSALPDNEVKSLLWKQANLDPCLVTRIDLRCSSACKEDRSDCR